MSKLSKSILVALSALSVDVGDAAPIEFRLCPAGSFRSARDGRPAECAAWVMDAVAAAAVIAAQSGLMGEFLIDYDHASLSAAAKPGAAPAPAAGWATGFEWREGDGLYAVGVTWNAAALAAIAAREYRYISPVFHYDKTTGRVESMLMAALTNYPALDDLTDLAAAAALVFLTGEDSAMDELLERLRWMLNLPVTATAEEISAELDKLKGMISADGAATAGLSAVLASKDAAIVELTAKVNTAAVAALSAAAGVDMTQFVPIAVLREYQTKLAALSGDTVELQVDRLIAEGRKTGKILGDAEEAWCRNMGLKDVTALSGYLQSRQGIAALSGLQTQGKVLELSSQVAAGPSEAEKMVAKQLGLSADKVAEQRGNI